MKFALVALAAATSIAGSLAVPTRGPESAHLTQLPRGNGTRAALSRRQNGDNPWGGAVQEGQGWSYVTGTAVVPDVRGQDPSAGAAVWVGIDGYSCQNAILQTGFTLWGDGRIETWYEWYPQPSYHYTTDLGVQPGHQLRMSVYADGTTGGWSVIENLSTGQAARQRFQGMRPQICQTDAEWIVEDFLEGQGHVPFLDFGRVQIYDAQASGPRGTVTPEGATMVEVTVGGRPRTQCYASGGEVDCRYV
ncbi:proteinase aspergillopepsin II [Metarhizium album ARSEF 1941]|uniref:Proteinase aspergillopepsin II n=1 Tax=Metarhizium album (strain ARSEF 1941) TaxID=1081103 RepID=A0A0B2X004_METAS|nr:proteinase aspergillopepsin II [Metarhizium album ARSEF 1941]KHN98415.1 proteinase aspergillopepsin II [Metarhizium album ARSEF 1941]